MGFSGIIEMVSYVATAAIELVTIRLNKRTNNITEYERRKTVFLKTKQFFSEQLYKKGAEKESLRLDINNVFKSKITDLFDIICPDLHKLDMLQFDMNEVMDLLKNENFEEYMWICDMDWGTDDEEELNRAKRFLDDLCYYPTNTDSAGQRKEMSYRKIEHEMYELKNRINSEKETLYSKMENKLK